MKPALLFFMSFVALNGALPRVSAQSRELKIQSIPYPLSWSGQPLNASLGKNSITITAGAKTDMFRDPNVTYNTDTAPKLLFQPDENFVLSASIEHSFRHKWDGGALVLIADSLNWIKFCFEKDYTGAHRVVSVVTKYISDDCNSIDVKSEKLFFKIAKADNVITLYCSTDGNTWLLIRHLQFNAAHVKVGFLAQSPTGDQCQVQFSSIKYQPVKIKDPYTGQ